MGDIYEGIELGASRDIVIIPLVPIAAKWHNVTRLLVTFCQCWYTGAPFGLTLMTFNIWHLEAVNELPCMPLQRLPHNTISLDLHACVNSIIISGNEGEVM